MQTNLDFLAPGQKWPPANEKKRLDRYVANRKLFEGEHAEVYMEQFKRIERVIGNFGEVVSYPVIINFQKLMSIKVADLLLGETPKIAAGEKDSAAQGSVDKIIENNDLFNRAYETAIDVSRFGDGLFYVYKGEEGFGVIDTTQPTMWFPVVSPDNLKKVLYHVLAWVVETGEGTNKKQFLRVQIHQKGKYEEREYMLSEGKIKNETKASKTVITGLSDFAIVHVPNLMTSDRITGIDDYTDVDSIVSELLVRLGQISKILDKHADPSVTGPSSALEYDVDTGQWKLKMGKYFARDNEEDPKVEYIVWDAQMEANFKTIERLINLLYTISEMGAAIFGDLSSQTGQVPSGSALRRLMISPLAKVNRIRMRFDPALKKAIKLCSQLGGKEIIDLGDKPISITWQDGLPGDPVEEADIMASRTANKATMSQKRALMTYDGMSEEDADNEITQIDEDETKANPLRGGNFPGANPDDDDDPNKKPGGED